jgi:hypothetical protein
MKRRIFGSRLCLLCFVAGAMLLQATSVAKGQGDIPAGRDITGTVIGISGRLAGVSRPFRLRINRYTSADEVQRLNTALQQGGEDELMRVLSGMEAGRIIIGNGVGLPANAIIATPQGAGGVKLTVLYQRNIPIFELRYGTRSSDYRFGFAELYLNSRGSNQGTLIPAARVRLKDGNTWEVEDFGEFPARLMGLQVRGPGGRNARR